MKLCVVILAGAADHPLESLGDRTPLEVARLPEIRELAAAGRVGGVLTLPKGATPSTEAAVLSILGRDPGRHPPAAGALLAVERGLDLSPRERAFRCDFVNVYDGAIVDPTAGRLHGEEARQLSEALRELLESEAVRLLPADRWRHLLVIGEGQAEGVRTLSPAVILGEPTETHLPTGPGCELLKGMMGRAGEMLAAHDVNAVRVDLGENPANGIWIWGGGRPEPPPADLRLEGAAIGVHPSFLGLARTFGLRDVAVPVGETPTGGVEGLGEEAARRFEEEELTVVLCDGAVEHSRLGEVDAKVAYLEAVDERVVAPLRARLDGDENARLMVVASHGASLELRREFATTVPFAFAGAGATGYGGGDFTESAAASADLTVESGPDLLEFARRS